MEIDVPAEHTFLDCGIREVSLDGCRYEVDLSPIGLLGKGFQGEVRAAREVDSGLVVAAKLMRLDFRARTEAQALTTCAHQTVVRLVGLWEAANSEHCVLLTELCGQGELFDTIVEYENGLPHELTAAFFSKIAAALAHMHAQKVAHRDLKAENVLLDNEGNPKLIDLGLAFIEREVGASAADEVLAARAGLANTKVGSMMYAAPEVVSPEFAAVAYDPYASDIWSLGVLLYCMLQGLFPFRVAIAELCPAFALYTDRGTLPWRAPFPEEAVEAALKRLLAISAPERVSARAALAEAWLKPGGATPIAEPPASPASSRKRTADEAGGACAEAEGPWSSLRLVVAGPGGAAMPEQLAGGAGACANPAVTPLSKRRRAPGHSAQEPPAAIGNIPASGSGRDSCWQLSGPSGTAHASSSARGQPLTVPGARSGSCDSAVAIGELTRLLASQSAAAAAGPGAVGASGPAGALGAAAAVGGALARGTNEGDARLHGAARVGEQLREAAERALGAPSADPPDCEENLGAPAAQSPGSGGAPDGGGGHRSGGSDDDEEDGGLRGAKGTAAGGAGAGVAARPVVAAGTGEGAGGADGGLGGEGGGVQRHGEGGEDSEGRASGGGSGGGSGARGAGGGGGGFGGGFGGGGGGGGDGGGDDDEMGDGGGDAGDGAGKGGQPRKPRRSAGEERRALVSKICKWVLTHCDKDRDSIVLTDAQGVALDSEGGGGALAPNRILAVTDAWCNLCGYTEAEAVGQSPRLTQGVGTDQVCIAGMRDAISEGRACKVSIVNYRKGGESFLNNLTLCPIRVRGEVMIYTGILRDYSTALHKMVTLRPQQYFKMTQHYTASRGLIARPPTMPMVIDVDDEDAIGSEQATDDVWRNCVVELHVRRLSLALLDREAEYLSLWLQDACATLKLPYVESVTEAGGREVICVTVQHGNLVCRGLVLPVSEPGHHRIVFERLRGDPLSYHKLFKQIAQHMQDC